MYYEAYYKKNVLNAKIFEVMKQCHELKIGQSCHLLRIALSIHELAVLEHKRRTFATDCNAIKFYTLVIETQSGLMLTINSSFNFLIYAMMSSELMEVLKKMQLASAF